MSKEIFDSSEIPSLPKSIRAFWGETIQSSKDVWKLSDIGRKSTFDFNKIKNIHVRHCVKLYLGTPAVSKSLSHLDNSYDRLVLVLADINGTGLENKLIAVIDKFISDNKNQTREYLIWYLKDWYLWCSDLNIPFFNEDYADHIQNLLIRGNSKGQAVLSLEENEGPLNEEELDIFVKLISSDSEISQGKVLAYMFLTLGSNPRNISFLKWEDFSVVSNGESKLYLLNVPRIKKRNKTRSEFKLRELDRRVGSLLEALRESSEEEYVFVDRYKKPKTATSITYELTDYLKDLTSCTKLEGVTINPRRLRYTFATRLVMSGTSKERLADLLDHTDLQNVQVYYDLKHKIKGFLTEAESKKLGNIFGRFEGKITSSRVKYVKDIQYFSRAANVPVGSCGSNSLCELNAPYSCFVCKKFNAFQDSLEWYQVILNDLLFWKENRSKDYDENDRIQFQMDGIIFSLKDLIRRIGELNNG